MSAPQFERPLAEFLKLREAGQAGEPRARELLAALDGFYWKGVEKAVDKALIRGGDALAFAPDEELLVDFGLLDARLVSRAAPDFLDRLRTERGSSSGDRSAIYLGEWLAERHRSFLATRTLPEDRVSQSLLLKQAAESDEELARSRQQRNELYTRVATLFEGLPGVGAELAQAIVRGTVDDRIEELLLASAMGAGARAAAENDAARQAQRYDRTALRALKLARERATEDEELVFLETIARLRSAIFRKSLVRTQRARSTGSSAGEVPAESRPDPDATLEEIRRFMRRELRLMRSLLRIGSQEGKVAQACSVLLYDAQRTTRTAVAEVLRLVRDVDPRVGLDHTLLIAPFTGSGFFEWDRDTLVAALSPARSIEDAVVNAVANLRLLADARQLSGRISAAYRDRYGTSFRERFLADYRSWVLRVGRGRRDALDDEAFAFFSERLGPPPGGPIVPAELAQLSFREREGLAEQLVGKMTSGRARARDLHHLAVLHWQAERIDAAIAVMEQAVKASPEDGRVLYSLGALCRRRHLFGEARKAFQGCARSALNSLWGIYANEALRRLS